MWVPVTVAAALAGGVFVGAQLPSGSDNNAVSPGASGGVDGTPNTPNITSVTSTQVGGTLAFTLADGWQVTQTSPTSACVTLKTNPKPAPAAAGSEAALPCGVDGLYVKTDAVPAAWPLSTAAKATGWWPADVSSASDIVCPVAKTGGSSSSSSSDMVKDSVLLRSTAKYELTTPNADGTQATADYHEWAVTCESGLGVQPMLWKLNVAPGTATPEKAAVATVVSVDPEYDSALLGMVGSLHPVG